MGLLLALTSACQEDEAGVLVNVQLETASLEVSELRLRGYVSGREDQVLEVTRSLPDGVLFGQTENIYLEVPRAWIGEIAWLRAEGSHNGVVTAHGSVSVLPRMNAFVETTLVLVAGASPCGNDVVEPGEQCDGATLGGLSCAAITGLPHGLLTCVDCQLDVAACHHCGNGEIEAGPESCDGENLGGETCQSQGFVTGELRCASDCRLDRSACEQGCGNGVIEQDEECDGADLARSGCADHGFLWGHLSCSTDCTFDTGGCVGSCGDGVMDPLEDCDGTDFGEQTCLTAAGRDAGGLRCTDSCHLNVSECHTCGDGVIEASEECDGPSLGGLSCADYALDGGALVCDASCEIDTSGCTQITCGNGTIDGTEVCDGSDLGVEDCLSQGFDGGTLACLGDCQFDTSGCTVSNCGNGAIDAGEDCDGTNLGGQDCLGLGFTGGTLDCDGSCSLLTVGCSSVVTGCGNGYVSFTEECDDGNLLAGDGCDPSCNTEPGYRCYDDPSMCVVDGSVLFVDCAAAPCVGTGTLADPFCSIADAVAVAASGQLLWLLSSCDEEVTIPPLLDLNISGETGIQWSAPGCSVLNVNAQVIVYGMHLVSGIQVNSGGSLTLRHSELGPSATGCEALRCNFDSLCVIERNHIHNNADGGIFTNGGSFRIVNNVIVENGTGGGGGSTFGGMRVADPALPPAIVMNNTVAYNMARSNQQAGVKCWGAVDVRSNIIWMNTPEDISNNCDPWYNFVSEPALNNVQFNRNQDPLFVNQPAGDYHIQTISPAVDSADPSGIPPAPPADFDGDSRFLGSGVDCGADEAF